MGYGSDSKFVHVRVKITSQRQARIFAEYLGMEEPMPGELSVFRDAESAPGLICDPFAVQHAAEGPLVVGLGFHDRHVESVAGLRKSL